MDRAQFELIGNVGSIEIKALKGGKQLAAVSLATSERWKREDGTWAERTHWHRVTVFAPAKVARIAETVQKGTRLRLVGQIRPGSYDDAAGRTRYVVEFVVGPFGEVEVLARGKPRPEIASADAALARPRRGKRAASSDVEDAAA